MRPLLRALLVLPAWSVWSRASEDALPGADPVDLKMTKKKKAEEKDYQVTEAKDENEVEFTSEMSGTSFDHLGSSVVQIESITPDYDIFEPYKRRPETVTVATGFAVDLDLGEDKGPVFVTEANTVRDAHLVHVKLPSITAERIFEGYVPVICDEYQAAIVRLRDPESFVKALKNRGHTLRPFKLSSAKLRLAMDVVAAGFSDGAPSLSLSRGVISSTARVVRGMRFVHTAQSSKSSAGGPIVAFDSKKRMQVIGMNSASDKGDPYVVPPMYLKQVLNHYATRVKNASKTRVKAIKGDALKKSTADKKALVMKARKAFDAERLRHENLRIAPKAAFDVEATKTHYDNSGGCTSGVVLTKLLPQSYFLAADPPVEQHALLVAVGKWPVDSTGTGHTGLFFGDPMPYDSMLLNTHDLDDPQKITTCKDGIVTVHHLSMAWKDNYEEGIHPVTEPYLNPEQRDFEVFADVTVMQLCDQHLQSIVGSAAPALGVWLLSENRRSPRLIITAIAGGTYASRILQIGNVLSQVNGHNVTTLEEFRRHFEPEGDVWTLETEDHHVYAVDFQEEVDRQLQRRKERAGMEEYLYTPALRAVEERRAEKKEAEKKEAVEVPVVPAVPVVPKVPAPSEAAA